MSIYSLLNQIKSDEIVLPGIQRDFVWPKERILKLLDSVMRGYPIGIALLWETYNDIQYRSFVNDYRFGSLYSYKENTRRQKLKLVLDGQQRLQSLYISLYGTLEGKSLYFDVLSGRDSDNLAEEKFLFEFFSSDDEVRKHHAWLKDQMSIPIEERDEDFVLIYYVKVADLFKMGVNEKQRLKKNLSKELSLKDEDELRLEVNFSRFIDALSKDEHILKISTIDENLPHDNVDRKSDGDVLEIFVRVNREITPLSRSDLIFSMLKLKWKESAEALPEFVSKINESNSFELDTDFVIRCLFTVSDLGAKFDFDLLRKKDNISKLRANFQKCCDAIKATVDFVQTECKCLSSRLIGSPYTLVPFVYYLFHTKNHEIRNDQFANLRKSFDLLAFARPFTRYAEGRLGVFIRRELKPLADENDETFPLNKVVSWISHWEGIKAYDEDFLRSNIPLTLHILQGRIGARVQYKRNSPEIDHIFPRSKLRKKGLEEELINHFANFWILAKGKNQNKSNRHPVDYFKDVDERVLKEALIEKEYFNYGRYTTFIKTRKEKILKKIKQKLQISEKDFNIVADA